VFDAGLCHVMLYSGHMSFCVFVFFISFRSRVDWNKRSVCTRRSRRNRVIGRVGPIVVPAMFMPRAQIKRNVIE